VKSRRVTDGKGKPVGEASNNPLLDTRQYEIELEDGSYELYQANLDYKLRFVTQAIGVHSLAHLSLFFALWRGKHPITAVGISALTTSILAVIVIIMGPNFRKSGAPLAPMIPFVGTYLFMSWKMLG